MGQTKTKRLEFHQKLIDTLGTGYKVYFQPPETLKMTYPCVVYSRQYIESVHADNIDYLDSRQYNVVLISRDPDDEAVDKLLAFPNSRYRNGYTAEGLRHDAFEIYY